MWNDRGLNRRATLKVSRKRASLKRWMVTVVILIII